MRGQAHSYWTKHGFSCMANFSQGRQGIFLWVLQGSPHESGLCEMPVLWPEQTPPPLEAGDFDPLRVLSAPTRLPSESGSGRRRQSDHPRLSATPRGHVPSGGIERRQTQRGDRIG